MSAGAGLVPGAMPHGAPLDERALRGGRRARIPIGGIGCEQCTSPVRNKSLGLDAA